MPEFKVERESLDDFKHRVAGVEAERQGQDYDTVKLALLNVLLVPISH